MLVLASYGRVHKKTMLNTLCVYCFFGTLFCFLPYVVVLGELGNYRPDADLPVFRQLFRCCSCARRQLTAGDS